MVSGAQPGAASSSCPSALREIASASAWWKSTRALRAAKSLSSSRRDPPGPSLRARCSVCAAAAPGSMSGMRHSLRPRARSCAAPWSGWDACACPGPSSSCLAPSPYGYRTRTRVLVEGGRVGYRQRRSHALCATRHCPVLVPELDRALEKFEDTAPDSSEWELASGEGGVVRIERLDPTGPSRFDERAGNSGRRRQPGRSRRVSSCNRTAGFATPSPAQCTRPPAKGGL